MWQSHTCWNDKEPVIHKGYEYENLGIGCDNNNLST